MRDQVDEILDQWRARRPDLDLESAAIVLRIDRADRHLQAAVEATLQGLGLSRWRFSVLSALRRADPQRGLRPGDLLRDTLSTTGAMTNRLDRLEEEGLVERVADGTDRRAVLVRLTDAGRALVDRAVVTHLENEAELVAHLDAVERDQLTGLLRRLLVRYEPAGEPAVDSSGAVEPSTS
jgi:DNA-binding MarR family transcriptional regulator